jgi:hypothetical protein
MAARQVPGPRLGPEEALLDWAKCMRKHGVDVGDPGAADWGNRCPRMYRDHQPRSSASRGSACVQWGGPGMFRTRVLASDERCWASRATTPGVNQRRRATCFITFSGDTGGPATRLLPMTSKRRILHLPGRWTAARGGSDPPSDTRTSRLTRRQMQDARPWLSRLHGVGSPKLAST